MPQEMVESIARDFIPILAVGGGLVIAFIAVVGSITARIVGDSTREKSRREIAAYVAEGSMTPEQGERLLNAGIKKDS